MYNDVGGPPLASMFEHVKQTRHHTLKIIKQEAEFIILTLSYLTTVGNHEKNFSRPDRRCFSV